VAIRNRSAGSESISAGKLTLLGLAVFALTPTEDQADDVALFEVHGILAQWLDVRGVTAVLVRPDHIVFGSAAGTDAGNLLAQALERALGANLEAASLAV
jgi:hypothetical protein